MSMQATALADANRQAVQAATTYIAAWNAHDAEAVRSCFTAQGVMRDPNHPAGITGATITDSVRGVLQAFPDLQFELTRVAPIERGVAFEWRASATHGGAKSISLVGCDVCELAGGKIALLNGYFDRAAIMEQTAA